MPGLQVPAPAPSSLPKSPKSWRPCSPLLPALSAQTSSLTSSTPGAGGLHSTSPTPWRSSASKSGHVPYPLCRARALLEVHPLWFLTQGQFLFLPLSLMISPYSRRRLGRGPGPRGSSKHTNTEICVWAPNGLLCQDSSSSRFSTDE